jgi:hypothetical protein
VPPVSDVSGDVGIVSVAGIPATILIGGAPHDNDGLAALAISAAGVAAGNMASQAQTALIGPGLNGVTVTPGVYDVQAGLLQGGVLTLDGAGVYIFRASSTLTSSGTLNLINGARACDVFWRVETAATINGTSFVGTIIANTGVHFGSGVTLDGRAFAINGDVTLINDHITGPTCAAATAIPNIRAQKTAQASGVSGLSNTGVNGLPNTGGAPIRNDELPIWLVIISSLAIVVVALGFRAYRRTDQPK